MKLELLLLSSRKFRSIRYVDREANRFLKSGFELKSNERVDGGWWSVEWEVGSHVTCGVSRCEED